jgi:DNA-binding NarL/FixJ family response regulator
VVAQHPKTPVLALSSTFYARVDCHGAVARALGVDCVLPKPASREALTNAVRNLLPR